MKLAGLSLVPVLVVVSSAGCFNSPDMNKISCTQDKYCPDGYVCVGVQPGVPGLCRKAGDGGGLDLGSSVDGAVITGIDGSRDQTTMSEAGSPGIDGAADKQPLPIVDAEADSASLAAIDSAVDLSVAQDIAADAPAAQDTLSQPDVLVGSDVPILPEAGPDTAPDLAPSPDLGPGCTISGSFYANGEANPDNACQTCQVSFSTTGWTVSSNGASCGTGQVCSAGTCQSGCWIGGTLVGSGVSNTSNACQICKPSAAATSWSVSPDGTDCGGGNICGNGTCQSACFIGGTIYASGATNASNPCQTCNPAISTTVWAQTRPDCAAITAGNGFSCAAIGGSAKCWGMASLLGTGATSNSRVAVQVTGLTTGVQAVAAASGSGSHACALVGGGVRCWGANSSGQLGNNTKTTSPTPVQVSGLLSGVQGITAGYAHSCALLNGGIQCWGADSDGQLGDGSQSTSLVPIATQNLTGTPLLIAAGGLYTCDTWSGGVQCWGSNTADQLGADSTTLASSSMPQTISGAGTGFLSIASGRSHTCVLANGSVLCWGGNGSGQLGNNSLVNSPSPVAVQGLPASVAAIGAGDFHTCAIVAGNVWCWGDNTYGQVGQATTTSQFLTATAVSGLPSAAMAVAGGDNHTCAILVSGAVWCWGFNTYGQLGNGLSGSSPAPVEVQGL